MRTEDEITWDEVRALMAGAGLVDHGNPLAYFHRSPAEFMRQFKEHVEPVVQQQYVASWTDAYNIYCKDPDFWHSLDGEDTAHE